MPSEIRHIVFTAAEILEALIEHRRRSGTPLPRGTVAAATVESAEGQGEVQFRVEMQADSAAGHSGRESLVVAAPEIFAILMGYCRSRNVPLPMRAEKTVQRFGNRIGLVLTMTARGKEKAVLGVQG